MASLIPWRRGKSREIEKRRDPSVWFSDWLFDDTLFPTLGPLFTKDWYPRVDVVEKDKEIVVEAELPGMDKKDIEVSLSGRRLTIEGEKTHEEEKKEKECYLMERSYGSFCRTIELPADVDPSSVTANYKKGVLKVTMKKTKEHQGKSIEIKTG